MATPKQAAENPNGSPEQGRRTDATAPAQGEVTAQRQQQVVTHIDTLLELLEHAPEVEVDQWYAENFGMLTQEMDRLQQLLEMPTAGYEGQTAFAKKEEAP
jgi:hypothetical protein